MFARGSAWFIAAPALAASALAIMALLWPHWLIWLFALLAFAGLGFSMYFFRDPERLVGDGVVSPADGKVVKVERSGGRWHVAIFMNVHDVHVNRAPVDCTVASWKRSGTGFAFAFNDDVDSNVRLEWALDASAGRVDVHQITGWFARRIVPYASEGVGLRKGQRFGMIRFGSRVEIWLPSSFVPAVAVGDRVLAGSTTLGDFGAAGGAA